MSLSGEEESTLLRGAIQMTSVQRAIVAVIRRGRQLCDPSPLRDGCSRPFPLNLHEPVAPATNRAQWEGHDGASEAGPS